QRGRRAAGLPGVRGLTGDAMASRVSQNVPDDPFRRPHPDEVREREAARVAAQGHAVDRDDNEDAAAVLARIAGGSQSFGATAGGGRTAGGSGTTEYGRRRRDRTARDYTRMLAQLGLSLTSSGRRAGGAAVTSGRWLADVVVDAAPRIPVRDLET